MKPSLLAKGGLLLALLLIAVPHPLMADPGGAIPVLGVSEGLPGNQAVLTWTSQPGLRYHVEKSTNLGGTDGSGGGGGWIRVAVVDASGPTATWRDPVAVTERCFYRVTQPAAEIFSIEPAVISSSGGLLEIRGQCLPPGSLLELLDDSGTPVASFPLSEVSAGLWRASVTGAFAPGSWFSARVSAPGVVPQAPPIHLGVTLDGRAADSPGSLPPAAPVPSDSTKPVPGIGIVVKSNGPKSKGSKRLVMDDGRDEDCDDADDDSAVFRMAINEKGLPGNAKPVKKDTKGSHRIIPPSSGLPGEVSFRFDALSIPCPAGPPLAWVMTYRSSVPLSSAHGPQWDFSYNISIEPQPAGSGSSAARLVVRDGGGRADVFHRQPDGTYRCDGLYRLGSFSGDTFTLTFADQGRWVFKPLDGSPSAGRIASIVDRNNVGLTCDYDSSGLLSSVSDAFGRSLLVGWDPSPTSPRISSVSDSTGRVVHFSAYASGESGGTEGSLKSISCAEIPGSPPEAAPFVFTYSSGQADPNLNDNLLSITDGEGRLLESFTWHPTPDRRSVEYDRCSSHDRRGGGHVTVLKSSLNSSGGYTIHQVDELGRLTETDCDKLHRIVSIRQFTGFCTPGTPADATTNRPTGKLRATDPDFFETRYDWNPDHALVQATDPDGSQLRFVHEREMKPGCPATECGNVRSVTLRSASGETRTVSFDYQPGFGTLESARPGNPIKGISVKGGRNPGGGIIAQGRASSGGTPDFLDTDDDDDGFFPLLRHKGWDGTVKGSTSLVWSPRSNFDGGDDDCDGFSALREINKGWDGTIKGVKFSGDDSTSRFRKILDYGEAGDNFAGPASSSRVSLINPIAMDKGLRFESSLAREEGGRHTPFHKRYRPQFSARGITINTSHIEYRSDGDCDDADPAFSVAKQSQGATFGERHRSNGWETGTDCGASCGVMELVSGGSYKLKAGFLYAAEPMMPRITRVITGHGQETTWTYDVHGNPASCATPVAGGGASFQYDALGRCTSVSLADGIASFVTDFDHDAATGMVSTVTQDPGGLAITTRFHYDALGRCIREVDPAGFDTLYDYLPSGRLSRCESPPVGSSRIATTFHYDQACRLVRCDVEHRDADGSLHPTNTAYSTFFVYDSRARLTRIAEEERPVEVTGELSPDPLGIENFAVCDFTINPAGEITRVSTPAACRGSTSDLVCDYQFDERGFLYRCIQGGLGTPAAVVDQIDYSPAGLPVRTARLAGGAPVSELHCDYDGFHRLSSVTDPMGNVVHFSYDNRRGVTTELLGEMIDAPGSAGNVLLARKTVRSSGRNSFQLGSLAVEDYLSLPGVGAACYDLAVTNTPSSACRSLFHLWETRDDVITEERFTPGSTAPPAVETTVVSRSPAGLVKQVSRNGDLLASFGHDSAGRTVTCSNGACSVSVTRDTRGNIEVCGETQHFRVGGLPPKTFSTSHQYDPLGRLVHSSDSSGNSSSQAYDSLGRVRTLVTAMACTVGCDYDGASAAGEYSRRVTADLDGDGSAEIVASSLHRSGEWKSSTDTQGHVTTATHDALGRLSRIDHPDGTHETFSYNARGLHHSGRLTDGTTRETEYDLNGRVVSVTLSGSPAGLVPVPPRVCSYDGRGRLVACHQGDSHTGFAWDSLGACVQETQDDVTVGSSYGHRGRTALFTSVQAPYQLHVSEDRDALGRVLSVSLVDGSGASSPPVASFEHLGLHPSRIVSGNGVITSYSYRGIGDTPTAGDHSFGMRPVRCTVRDAFGNVLSEVGIARNPGQQATGVSTRFSDDPAGPGRLLSLTRDSLGRVTGWSSSRREAAGLPPVVENTVSHTLDSRGMRVQTTGGPNPGSYSQSPALPPGDAQRGRYTTWPQGALEWDENRNLSRIPYGDTTHRMQHDALGRLVSITDDLSGSPVAEFTYDALDRLLTLTVHDGTVQHFTRFIYDGTVCIQELGADGTADLTHVVSGGVRHCISTRNGTILYPHSSLSYVAPCDASEVLTGATGAIVEHRTCDGDGRPLFLTPDGRPSSTGSSATPVRWMAPESLVVPGSRTCSCPAGYHSFELGTVVSTGSGKIHTRTGHVTLMK